MGILKKLKGYYSGLSIPLKSGLWFMICGLFQKGIAFLTTPIYTRLLSTEQFGKVNIYNSWEGIVFIFCTLNLFYGGFNNGMRDYVDKDEYVSLIQGLIMVLTCVCAAAYLVNPTFWSKVFELDTSLIFFMFLEIAATSSLLLWSAKNKFIYNYKPVITITMLETALVAIIPLLFIFFCNTDADAGDKKIVISAITYFIICFPLCIYNLKKGRWKFYKGDVWKAAFLFNIVLLPHYFSSIILNQADRIMISKMIGLEEAGIYSLAYSVAMVFNILVTSANNALAPWLYESIAQKRLNDIKKNTFALLIPVAIILVLFILFCPEFVSIFAGEKYIEAVYIIPPVSISLYFMLCQQIFANVEFYFSENKFIAAASVICALLNVLLNYIFIKIFGYFAAGYTTLFCYMLFSFFHSIFAIKVCNKNRISFRMFDYKKICTLGFFLVVYSIIISILYHNLFVRLIIFIAILSFVIVNRQQFRNVISTFKNDRGK